MPTATNKIADLDQRSQDVFQRLVEAFLESGDPVGSRTLARTLSEKVSAATVRNTMQDLEYLGLLGSPHISAGRVPTELGLRLFVDGFMEVGKVSDEDRAELEKSMGGTDPDIETKLDRAGSLLSGLTQGASLVLAPKIEAPIKHLEFVAISPEQAMVVLVTADGGVENRLFNPPRGMTPSAMREAANFLSTILQGHTLPEIATVISQQIENRRQELNSVAARLVDKGLATWAEDTENDHSRLIVRGRANLLDAETSEADIDRIRILFDDLERKRDLAQLLDLTEQGEGVRVFIGSENKLFSLSGSSLVVSPYMNAERQIIGAVGVIGPTRLNYGRVVPIVDYTAQLLGRMVSGR